MSLPLTKTARLLHNLTPLHPPLTPSSLRLLTTSPRPPQVRILEVGPRDGLQNIKTPVPTTTKLSLIRRLLDAGLTNIETTSFVSPKWIPQLADNAQVFAQTLQMTQGLHVSLPVLVPNMKGLRQAVESQARDIVVFASASEGFSWRNTNCSVEEGLGRAEEVARAGVAAGMRVRGVVSCVFSCPYDGPTEPGKVLRVVRRFLEMGCYEVGLGDTVGVGTPVDVERLLRVLMTEVPVDKLAGHFHDTYGQAVANVVKSYDMGIRAFDSSVAGLGGCPYAKGARGNLASEDMIYTLERAGVHTGVDLEKLAVVGEWISKTLNLPNNSRAGTAISIKLADTPKSVDAPPRPTREWQQIADEGEYRVSRAGSAVKITLARPKNGNALTTKMVEDITALFRRLAQDQSVFHIVLEAEGKFFCTGMDLSSAGTTASNDAHDQAEYYKKVRDLFMAIEQAPQTTIAVIHGSCFGGGVGLAFVFDIRIASEKTKFTMTEIRLGLTPAVISRFLVREWGVSFLREAMLTGREVSATELARIGVVHSVTDTPDEKMNEYLDTLSQCAPRSAGKIKELIQLGYSEPAGVALESQIRTTFATMMQPGSEGEHGTAQFRKKIKGIDWASFWANQTTKSKL